MTARGQHGEVWTVARGRHGGSAVTYEGRRWRGQRSRNGARMQRRGVLTGASDGVDGGVGEDGGMASQAREAWRAFITPKGI
jgi:hypothetical protein